VRVEAEGTDMTPQLGDIVMVRGTVAGITKSGAIMIATEHPGTAAVHPNSIVSIEPRPIRVGDTVTWTGDEERTFCPSPSWHYIGTVIAIMDGKAWLRVEGANEFTVTYKDRHVIRPLSMLRVTRT
jgi:hypothetical protein